MRCVACGVDMELVRAAPDNSMIPSGCEIGTYECPRCHSTALRRMPAPGLEPFADERMQLPTISSALMVSAMRKLSLARKKAMVSARSGMLRALTMLRANRSGGT